MSDLISREAALRAIYDALTYAGSGEWDRSQAEFVQERIEALPAVQPKVKPLKFEVWSDFKESGCIGKPHPFQYFITQGYNGKYLCHHDTSWHDDLAAAQARAQAAYQIAALAPAVQHDAAAIREAALVAVLKECADDLESYVEHAYPIETRDKYPTQEAKYARDMEPVVKARAWIEYAGKEVMPDEDQKPNITKSDTAPAGLSAGGGAEPTDTRPTSCRFRLRDEGKLYPRGRCDGCRRTIFTGLKPSCPATEGGA